MTVSSCTTRKIRLQETGGVAPASPQRGHSTSRRNFIPRSTQPLSNSKRRLLVKNIGKRIFCWILLKRVSCICSLRGAPFNSSVPSAFLACRSPSAFLACRHRHFFSISKFRRFRHTPGSFILAVKLKRGSLVYTWFSYGGIRQFQSTDPSTQLVSFVITAFPPREVETHSPYP